MVECILTWTFHIKSFANGLKQCKQCKFEIIHIKNPEKKVSPKDFHAWTLQTIDWPPAYYSK